MLCSQRLRRFASIRTCFFDERHGPIWELRSHFYPYKNDNTRLAGGLNQTKYDETRLAGGLNEITYDKTRLTGGFNETTYDETRLAGGFRAIPVLGMGVIAKQANYLPAF